MASARKSLNPLFYDGSSLCIDSRFCKPFQTTTERGGPDPRASSSSPAKAIKVAWSDGEWHGNGFLWQPSFIFVMESSPTGRSLKEEERKI